MSFAGVSTAAILSAAARGATGDNPVKHSPDGGGRKPWRAPDSTVLVLELCSRFPRKFDGDRRGAWLLAVRGGSGAALLSKLHALLLRPGDFDLAR